MAISAPALFAVVPNKHTQQTTGSPRRHRTISELRADKLGELQQKKAIDRASHVLTTLEDRTAELAKEIARLQKRKALAAKRIEAIEDRVIGQMQAAGLDRADGFHTTFALRPAPLALQVDDEAQIPAEYFRSKVTATVDKNAIKAALASGVEVSGVSLSQKVTLLRK